MLECDVAVVGGGLAGLCFARQLMLARPATRIVLVEPRNHPAPEAAFKIGESTAELAGHYLGRDLGLGARLEERQLIKTGLRFFFPGAGNFDIAQRPELGHLSQLPVRTFQLDRGRLENDLTEDVRSLGVDIHQGSRVDSFTPGDGAHRLGMSGQTAAEISARWVVDASGRPGFLKRRLELARRLDHDVNAAWFRLAARVDVHDWSSDPAWRARLPAGFRWRSTCHFTGEGYWFWVIALASGSTSFGLVADPRWHPFNTFNTFERLLGWLEVNEPQVAGEIRSRRQLLQDFQPFRHFATDCTQVFSDQRWAIVGEAGRFLDPLYSIGSDMIAIGNTLTTAMIVGDLEGQGSLQERVRVAQEVFDLFFATGLDLYRGQYGIFGDADSMAAKSFWDTISYYGIFALLFCQGKFSDLAFLAEMEPAMRQLQDLNAKVQARLREIGRNNLHERVPPAELAATGSRERDFSVFISMARDLVRPMTEKSLRGRISENLRFLESLATEVCVRADRTESGWVSLEPAGGPAGSAE